MKTSPFGLLLILPLMLAGCHPPENPATQMSRQIQQWVPGGTPLAAARQILEQHQFTCSVSSYDSKAAMPPGSDTMWWDDGNVMRGGKAEAVTNVSLLTGTRNETNDGVWVDEVVLTAVNGQTDTRVTASARRIQ